MDPAPATADEVFQENTANRDDYVPSNQESTAPVTDYQYDNYDNQQQQQYPDGYYDNQ